MKHKFEFRQGKKRYRYQWQEEKQPTPENRRRSFYAHLGSYLIMGVFFVLVNLLTNPGHLWFYWPLLGWGIGVAFDGLDALILYPQRYREAYEEEEAPDLDLPRLDQREREMQVQEREPQKKWDERDLV